MRRRWYHELSRYHWFVLAVASLGWLFDSMDQQLFVLARPSAMDELVPPRETAAETQVVRKQYAGVATSVFLAGWALGGLVFGVLGDRIGRAKVMMITILMYSAFTGLSAMSVGFWDFAFYRFLTGLGVGGEFAVGVALVAEVMPATARPWCLTMLQMLSTVGNVSAALLYLALGVAEEQGMAWAPWRIMFVVGALPALLAVIIRRRLKEPEKWQKASHDEATKKTLGSYAELFRDPVLRKHALLGLLLACSGVIGLWAVGFFAPDLMRTVQTPRVREQTIQDFESKARLANDADRLSMLDVIRREPTPASDESTAVAKLRGDLDQVTKGRLTRWQSYTSLMTNIGGFFGMFGFGALAQRFGRRPTFAIALIAAFASTAMVFAFLQELWQIFVLVPLMGFCQMSLFAGYAMYFPELFPTRLRSTGTSFCYNVGRFVASVGPLVQAGLIRAFADRENPLQAAGVTMSTIFLIGLVALPFLPETKGKPLPE